MNPTESLAALVADLSNHPAVVEKADIARHYSRLGEANSGIRLGDDCAAIPDPETGGHLLFAAEGMLESFVREDPWFAGYSAIMVNVSDIASMGGRAIAVTDMLWSHEDECAEQIWQGMLAASKAYGVPIVGGHTTVAQSGSPTHLGVAILGRAGANLITSFDVVPSDKLLVAIDMNGAFRGDKPFWNASTTSSPLHLSHSLEILPKLAESGWCRAGKDISNGGIVGTLAMLMHSSGKGAVLQLDALERPADTPWLKWLTAFPSFGYLLAVADEHVPAVRQAFESNDISVLLAGEFTQEPGLVLSLYGESLPLKLL